MAVTANDICKRALKRLRILAADEEMETAVAVDTLAALNSMMFGWKAEGVDILHSELIATDNFPLDESFQKGTTALLAVYIADDTGKDPSASTVRDASLGWDALCSQYSPANRLRMDSGLTQMPSQNARYWVWWGNY